MMNRIAVLLLACVACASLARAESNLGAPVVGVTRDSLGQLRQVYGVAGNFVLRDAIIETALNWAFDGKGGLVKTYAELLTLDRAGKVTGRRAMPRGSAILSAGAAFFPATSELWLIGKHPDRQIRIEPDALGGDVVALGTPDGRSAPLAVCRANHVWLVLVDVTSNAITRETLASGLIGDQGCAGALLWIEGNFLLARARDLIIQTAAGDERHLPFAGGAHGAQAAMHRAGDHWVQVEGEGAPPLLVLVTSDGEKSYRLPSVEPRP
ncbi:MAG TPA: hypothetical protein VNH83_13855 [Bryobacteraceae bacterium]|jgi:hypothetical protein|nr:hypothetical protein [Bryobacteraceae bacterium]